MTQVIFPRVGVNDKAYEMTKLTFGVQDDCQLAGHTFLVEPSSFPLVPNAAFAY